MPTTIKGFFFSTSNQTGRNTSKHVAVFPDGTIKVSENHPTNCDHFNQKGWKWTIITEMPSNCEYIGNYPANM